MYFTCIKTLKNADERAVTKTIQALAAAFHPLYSIGLVQYNTQYRQVHSRYSTDT